MIKRTPLRADVHHELLGLILQGTLEPGRRLRDTELAAGLGVSRTPVREALLRLEREGFITSQMGQGFSVRPLSEQEVREVYPLVSLLERSALRELRGLPEEKAQQLNSLAADMEQGDLDPLRRIDLDMAWHRTLLTGCENSHLFRILDELKRIIFRYEYAFMQVTEWVSESVQEHRALTQSLAAGHGPQTEKLMEAHWEKSMHAVLSNLRAAGSRN